MSGPILVFDSGVGGLSVLSAIRRQLPGVALAYVCDNAMLPYGTKPDAWLVTRIAEVCRAAVAESAASALVVACNTASTLALRELRASLGIPVIGTVPAIKPAAAATLTGTFGLLATSATVNRPYTDALIRDFAAHCRVVRVAADALVAQAERQLGGQPLDQAVLQAQLAPLWAVSSLDTVILGCTHFPLLARQLDACAPRPITWVDSGEAIARRVADVVVSPAGIGGPALAWATAPGPMLTRALAGYGFAAPRLLPGLASSLY